jgi:ABC-2 type transport system permease protein
MLMQVSAIFFILAVIFKADLGPSISSLLLLFSVFALTSVALGMAISSFSKDLRQDNAMAYLITIPMSMIGGCFWPREIMPKALQQLSNFSPVTWVLKATEKLLYGSSINAIGGEIAVLLLFALVFLIVGSNKRVMMKG